MNTRRGVPPFERQILSKHCLGCTTKTVSSQFTPHTSTPYPEDGGKGKAIDINRRQLKPGATDHKYDRHTGNDPGIRHKLGAEHIIAAINYGDCLTSMLLARPSVNRWFRGGPVGPPGRFRQAQGYSQWVRIAPLGRFSAWGVLWILADGALRQF